MTIQHIHWSNLVASPRNVRKVKAGIESLAASIAADGLLHNLTVTAREDGKSEVVAGERRRRAIIQLVRAGTWPRDTHIPCEVRECEDATAISYAENAQRVAMHPADAIRAFATLASEGHDEPAIANRYGYDPREVRKMLTLASLSRRVLNALAADKIDVATAQAFTLTDDHKRQEKVLRVARTAHEVRRLLTDTKVTTGHRLFRFVGADAYSEAGGGITRDLFAKDGEGYADDPALVQQLADAKFEALASEAEEAGWGEVIASEQTPYETYQWHRVYPDDGEGYSHETKAGAVLLITVTGDGAPTTIAYTKKAKRSHSAGRMVPPSPVRSTTPRRPRSFRGSGPPRCNPRSRAMPKPPLPCCSTRCCRCFAAVTRHPMRFSFAPGLAYRSRCRSMTATALKWHRRSTGWRRSLRGDYTKVHSAYGRSERAVNAGVQPDAVLS